MAQTGLPRVNKKALAEMVRTVGRANLSSHVAKTLKFGMSPRQLCLNAIWSIYRGTQYDLRPYDWNGSSRNVDISGTEAIIQETYIPNGFATVTAADQTSPLKMRRPPAPYRMPTAIVHKFTAMLFGEGVKPRFIVEGDPVLEDWLDGCAEASHLWQRMRRARNFGGATGTCVVMPAFLRGKPYVEIFDPRFCVPTWLDRREHTLSALEYRYMYAVETWDDKANQWVNVWFWYRRVIDKDTDKIYVPVRVDDENPSFAVQSETPHPFGECPVIWAHNTTVDDAEDGDADFWPALESFNELDTLNAQGRKGIKANCDPTLGVFTEKELGTALRKGSENAIVLNPQDKLQYLEIVGTGPAAALMEAREIRREILEVCQCVLEQPDSKVPKTATEIMRVYMGMLSRTDDMRGQYGDGVILPLARLWIKGAQALSGKVTLVNGAVTKQVVVLPLKKVTASDGSVALKKRVLPENIENDEIHLKWPPYFQSTPNDLLTMVQAANEASGTLLDDAAAIRWIAPAFGIEDPDALIMRIREQREKAEAKERENAREDLAAKAAAKPVKPKKGVISNGKAES